MKQIEAGGQTFGVNATWGMKLDYQARLGEFWRNVQEQSPPIETFKADLLQLQHEYLCGVLAEVNGKAVKDTNAALLALDEETVGELLVGLGLAEKLSSAEGNEEGDSTSPPEAGSPESQ